MSIELQSTAEYVKWANTLDSAGEDSTLVRERLKDPQMIRYLHSIFVGVINMSNAVDKAKKYLYYGKVYPEMFELESGPTKFGTDWLEGPETRNTIRLLHAVLGLTSEIGEMTEPLFNFLFKGEAIDPNNIQEEAGDCQWYLALIVKWRDVLEGSAGEGFGPMLNANYRKLTTRYPDKVWTQTHALDRNLEQEKEALEGGT